MDVDSQPIPALDAEPIGALDSFGIVMEATARADETFELAARHLESSLVHVLRILGFDTDYVTARAPMRTTAPAGRTSTSAPARGSRA